MTDDAARLAEAEAAAEHAENIARAARRRVAGVSIGSQVWKIRQRMAIAAGAVAHGKRETYARLIADIQRTSPMSSVIDKIVYEDEHRRVRHVTIPGQTTHMPEPRLDRIIVAITGSAHERDSHIHEKIQRQPGDVTFRRASQHAISNRGDLPSTVVMIEFKTPPKAT